MMKRAAATKNARQMPNRENEAMTYSLVLLEDSSRLERILSSKLVRRGHQGEKMWPTNGPVRRLRYSIGVIPTKWRKSRQKCA